jgi:INO80 complex subunit B
VPSSEEDEGAVGSVGDTAGADQTSPEDHEPAEDGAAEEEGSEGEEEAWLVAMEKGQLDKTGYVPRRPGTSLTTRQKAMLGSTDEQLLELPLGKARQEMTEEMILKKTEKNRKRRQAAQRRKEKRKTETVRKLLEKQTKKKDEVKATADKRVTPAFLHYVRSSDNSSISLAPGINYPLPPQTATLPAVPQQCAVPGCSGRRRYCDSASGLPLCSLACYKTLHSHTNTHSINKI